MTSPRATHPGAQLWQRDEGPVLDRNTLVLVATAVWVLLLLIGLLLTFS